MDDYYTVRRHSMLTALSLLLVLSACDPGSSSSSDVSSVRDDAAGMSVEREDGSVDPSAVTPTPPAGSVGTETMQYADVDDEIRYGHFAFPSSMIEPLPAVLMIHEWWGLDDHVRAMANRLAAEGYMVLAIDLYGGETAAVATDARKLMLEVAENPGSAQENIRQALAFLNDIAGAPKVAALGWGFGGSWSINTAYMFPESINASICYYGQVTDDHDNLRLIEDPLLGLFAEDDTGVRLDSVEDFQTALQRLRIDHDVHVYPGVGHAFANPSSRNYDAPTAEAAWQRTLEFLAVNLAPDDEL